MKISRIPFYSIAIISIASLSCANAITRLERAKAEPNQLPRTWLVKRVDPKAEFKQFASGTQPWFLKKWEEMTQILRDGDEFWYWESNKSEAWFFSGYCVIRQNQVLAIIETKVGTWVD